MAVATEICATAYEGNGSIENPYPITWPFIDVSHIKVRVRDVSIAPLPDWVELGPGEYQVLLWDDEGEETNYNPRFITSEPYASTHHVVVYRDTPKLQPTEYPTGDPFPARSHEMGLDRMTMIIQELVRDYLGSGGSMQILFGNPYWKESQGEPWVLEKPFEEISNGGNGAADQGKAAVFDAEGGLSLMAATLMGVKRIGFSPEMFSGIDGTRSLTAADNGRVLYYTGEPAITLSAGSSLPDGFSCKIMQEGVGQITIDVSDLDLRHPDAHTKSRAQWSAIYLSRRGANFILEGDTVL